MINRSIRGLALALGTLAVLLPAGSPAQDLVSKPLRLIVTFAPGGPADTIARNIIPAMSAALGRPIVMDNRGGAGGIVGMEGVAKAAPDGSTIGLGGTGAMVILPYLQRVPYEVLGDIEPITLVARQAGALVTHPKTGFKTVADLVAFARAHPGKVNFASAGIGTSIHLSGELFKQAAMLELVHVPYAKGAAPAITDLIGGHVDIMLPVVSAVLSHIQSGALVALAVTSKERSSKLPGTPTLVESGYPTVVSETWFGLIAPAKMPDAMINRLHAAAIEAMRSPEVIKRLDAIGADISPMTRAEYRTFIAAEQTKWKSIIEAAGLDTK